MQAAKADQFLGGHAVDDQRLVSLFAIEHAVQLVGSDRLVPEDVAGMSGFFERGLPVVCVEDRTAKCHVLGAVAVASQSHMAAGQNKLELVGAGLPKNGDRLAVAESANVTLELLIPTLVPTGMRHSFEDLADQHLLVGSIETALDRRLGDLPIVFEARSQQTTVLVDVIPVEADFLSLLFLQGVVQDLDCLLYTSPSPRDGLLSRMPSSA